MFPCCSKDNICYTETNRRYSKRLLFFLQGLKFSTALRHSFQNNHTFLTKENVFKTPKLSTLLFRTRWIISKVPYKISSCAEIHTTYMITYVVSCMNISVMMLNPPFYFQWLVIWTTFTVFIDDPGKCNRIYVDEVVTFNGKSVPQKRQTYADFSSLRDYSNRILSVECLFYLHNVPEISRYSPISSGNKAVTYETRFACHQHLTHELEFFLRPASSPFR